MFLTVMCRHQFKGQDFSRHCLTHGLNSYHTLTLRPNIKGGTAGLKYLRSYILSRGETERDVGEAELLSTQDHVSLSLAFKKMGRD